MDYDYETIGCGLFFIQDFETYVREIALNNTLRFIRLPPPLSIPKDCFPPLFS